ncbi:phage portal protein [Caballeronia cordobensis]|uniref:phage portal protein n=1 Tax=Caballeronia cordobensis TaxID=1353886 RepID=UPI00045EF988|nr:phage portal protein, HK97 family [Burkholderia sp. RPE67]
MRLLGFDISFSRASRVKPVPMDGHAVGSGVLGPFGSGGWWPLIARESFSGAWQRNIELRPESILAYHAVYACITLISADVGKLAVRLMKVDDNDIWLPTQSPAFSPVLRKPNRYQNHIQFIENWIMSKLTRGNTYVLKDRDNRGVVIALYVLDPNRVRPLVTEDGGVYYQLDIDQLAGVVPDRDGQVIVPASEIIHDRMNCLFHPLVGTSPLFACALAARQGLAILNDSAAFFENGAEPGGILVAPGAISDETAKRLKDRWEENYGGSNRGRIAVLGDNLKYEPLTMTAVDAQLIEQLRMTSEIVCSVFHVPGYMVGVGAAPTYNNIEALSQNYYSQCLQSLIESFELCLDEGLALPDIYRTELDLDGLLRMDTATMVKTLSDAVGGGIAAPNEARKKLNLRPMKGGDTPYMQQQNYSLAALDERDRNQPFAKPDPAPNGAPVGGQPASTSQNSGDEADDETREETDQERAVRWLDKLLAGLSEGDNDHA